MQVLVNEFCLFQALYRCHFLHDFHTWGVTFKGKALATKCIFQNYSQLLDICTRLVLKTAKELILPSVCLTMCKLQTHIFAISYIKTNVLKIETMVFGMMNAHVIEPNTTGPNSWKRNNFNPPLFHDILNKSDYTRLDLFFLLFLKQTRKEIMVKWK